MLWAGCQPQLSGREFGKPDSRGPGFAQRSHGHPTDPSGIRLGGQRCGQLDGLQIPHPAGLGAQYVNHCPLPSGLGLWTAKVRGRHHRMLDHSRDIAQGTVLLAPKRALWTKHLRDEKRFSCPQCLLILRDLLWAQEFSILYR